jgi:pimeloyl-ACP methyl ester carboxylesterase
MKKLAWLMGIVAVFAASLFFARDYLGITDIPAAVLKERYGQDAYFVDVLGAQVRVKESGRGEPLLLLHGFAASADTWDGWRRYIGAHYRVIAVDVTPFALTGPLPGRSMTPEEVQNFLDALTEKLGLSEFYLAGNSLGGFHAWNHALRHPERVKKLILVDSAGYPREAPFPVKLMRTPGLREITSHLSPRFLVEDSVRAVYGEPSRVTDEQIQRYHDLLRREGSRAAVAELMTSMQVVDPEPIKRLRLPTLILWGGRDTWIPPEHAEYFRRDIPGSQLIVYDELGHVPMEEDPARTALDVLRFLRAPAQADAHVSL